MTLTLGTTRKGRNLRLSSEERSRHIHVVGASGTGKSKLLESMIRQDILSPSGHGLCLIDPHGTLADAIVEWCAALNIGKHRRIHVIDAKDETWAAGFNPLRDGGGIDLNARVDAMVATCAEVWGGEDINQTPLLTTCLQLVFYALAVNQLTLVEAVELTSTSDIHAIRQRLTGNLPDQVYGEYWRDFQKLVPKEFEDRFSSTRRRMLRFLGAPVVRRIVGQRQSTFNFKQVMDDGDIVIVNLAPRGPLSQENARLLGAMITSELRLAAFTRDEETARRMPFHLYIDECYDFLTGDVEAMLDQTRKFGLHLILAHQRLGQLKDRSEKMFNAVMAGGQTKIVFGGMTDEDAEIMAKHVYRSTFNLEQPKHILDKPVVVDEVPYWLESESWGTSESASTSSGASSTWGSSSGTSSGQSSSYGPDGGDPYGYGTSEGSSSSESWGGGSSHGTSETSATSRSQGRSQTLKPVRVMMPTAVHSLDEQLHLAIVKLRELPNQSAIIKRRGSPPVRIRPETVKPPLAWAELTSTFVEQTSTISPYMTQGVTADAEITARFESLRDQRLPTVEPQSDETTFWSEE
jgi:hypothetical protein